MIKFDDYQPSVKVIKNPQFQDPNTYPEIVDFNVNLIRYGEHASIQYIDVNQFWQLIRDPKSLQNTFATPDQKHNNLRVPIFYVDRNVMHNTDDGCYGFMTGSKTIPAIIIRDATDDDIRQVLKYPASLTIRKGVVCINSETSNYQPLVWLNNINSVQQAQKIIDKIVNKLELKESVITGNVINRFRDFSNQSFVIGKVTNNESTNSYQLMLDKDNMISLKLIPMLSSDDEDCVSVFIDGTYHIKQLPLTAWNHQYIAQLFNSIGNLRKFVNQLQNNAIVDFSTNYVTGIQNSYYNDYNRQLLLDWIRMSNPDVVVMSNQAITVATVDNEVIKYSIEINNETNVVDISATLTNYYIGDININNDNQQKLIDNFAKIVKNVNNNNDISTVLQIRNLLITK